MRKPSNCCCCWLLSSLLRSYTIHSWQQWNYSSFTTDDWKDLWGPADGPQGRQGHSIVLWNETKIVMFGGRDNEVQKPHVPKTYELVDDEGILKFESYDQKPVREGYDPLSCQPKVKCIDLQGAKSGNNQTCSYSWDHILTADMTAPQRERKEEECGFATSGVYYNDVWMYDLECTRFADLPCVNDGWKVLHAGNKFGGCKDQAIDINNNTCDTPFARWGHGAIMSDNTTMLIYGGYSQECEDYCDDMWMFDLNLLRWRKVEINSTFLTPSQRWRFSFDRINDIDSNDSDDTNVALLFGGHRLWHGFASENSEDNMWESFDTYQRGGYLNDMWMLSYRLDAKPNATDSWIWSKVNAKETCLPSPGLTWKERNDIVCQTFWPRERSGHASVFDTVRNGLWIHGGFTSQYPYPSSSSAGSAKGVLEQRRKKGFIPYASHSYFLNDLWFYNVTDGYWKQLKQRNSNQPAKRKEHLLILSDNILILHGGYADNHYFNDTWYYYIDENRWLQKTDYVHMFFPEECTDDVAKIVQESKCIELSYPPLLKRSPKSTFGLEYQDILPFEEQPGYTPDVNNSLYFGIVHNAHDFVANLRKVYLENELYDGDGARIWIKSDIPDGTPIAPRAATAPRQYAQLKHIQYNETFTLDVWEWCSSVEGEPTRGRKIDGLYGRSNKTISLPQLRRQSPGWDGCRDFRWKYPPSRTDHKAVFVKRYSMIFLYGGLSYQNVNIETGEHPNTPSLDETHKTLVKDDLWILGIDNCPKNCSDQGTCSNGFCHCFPGFYGLDCSNVTCPGSVCYYDNNNDQHCTHCCYDGYIHSDEDQSYLAGTKKIPCRQYGDLSLGIFTGNSNGICDGFGACQCAPPFLGEDCSIRDCQHDCSFNGYCSIEFPNSRCICNNGYFGEYCQYLECPYNCSYPNGICNHSDGKCSCKPIFSPYNASEVWTFWQGDDCSYLTPWCGCNKLNFNIIVLATTVMISLWISV